jgi:hypothetical protein
MSYKRDRDNSSSSSSSSDHAYEARQHKTMRVICGDETEDEMRDAEQAQHTITMEEEEEVEEKKEDVYEVSDMPFVLPTVAVAPFVAELLEQYPVSPDVPKLLIVLSGGEIWSYRSHMLAQLQRRYEYSCKDQPEWVECWRHCGLGTWISWCDLHNKTYFVPWREWASLVEGRILDTTTDLIARRITPCCRVNLTEHHQPTLSAEYFSHFHMPLFHPGIQSDSHLFLSLVDALLQIKQDVMHTPYSATNKQIRANKVTKYDMVLFLCLSAAVQVWRALVILWQQNKFHMDTQEHIYRPYLDKIDIVYLELVARPHMMSLNSSMCPVHGCAWAPQFHRTFHDQLHPDCGLCLIRKTF